MSKIKIYDKASWHYPEGEECPSLKAALIHLDTIYNWLKKNKLLTAEAQQISPKNMGGDYSLTSEDINKKGKIVLDKCYDKWLEQVDYKHKPNTNIFDKCLKQLNINK